MIPYYALDCIASIGRKIAADLRIFRQLRPGRPAGGEAFVDQLEKLTHCSLQAKKQGRPFTSFISMPKNGEGK
jgi:hypothetical protein